MHLPEPALSFTLPSIHDGIPLDCRVYHPLHLSRSEAAWRPRHAAIVAHPYGPLGGSYDDPIVQEIASEFLKKGFIIGTFNFRGGGESAGRTSWTSKPERDDYMSMIGFMTYYIHLLDESRPQNAEPPILVQGGYSYGAMITSQLPPLQEALAPFAAPSVGSYHGQIRLRAETLAKQMREIHAQLDRRGLRMGEGGSPRRSNDHRRSRSFDEAEQKLKKGVREVVSKVRSRRSSSHGSVTDRATEKASAAHASDVKLTILAGLVIPRPAYLLISPLQGIITHLATMSRSPIDAAAESKLRENRSLALFGDRDIFVSVQKLRNWRNALEAAPGSKFRGTEILGAGHFWIEEGVLNEMIELVQDFIRGILQKE